MSRSFFLIGIFLIVVAGGLLFLQQNDNPEGNQSDQTTNLALSEPKITQVAMLADCTVQLTINGNTKTLPTAFDPAIAKCEKYTVSSLSPSGNYVAFEDLSSSGIDAVVSLYELSNDRVYTLDDFGTESVLDMVFLPSNRLLVLYSQGISGKQSLRLYDVPSLEPLLADVPPEGDLSTETLNPFVFERDLDDAKGIAKAIRLTDTSVVLVDEFDDITNPLFKISLSEL